MTVIKRQTVFGTVFSYAGVLIGTLTQAFLFTKYLETDQVGLFAMISNWALIFVFIANLGYNSAGTKYFDKFRDKALDHKGYLFNGIVFFIIGLLLVWFLLNHFRYQILANPANDSHLFEKYYGYIFPLVVATGLFNIFDNYAKGLYDTIMGNFLSQFLQRFLVFLVILFFILHFYSFDNLVLFWFIGMSVPTIIMLLYSIRLGDFSLKPSSFLINSHFFKDFARFAGFSVITGLSSIVITKLDSLLVYEYLGLSQIGIYNFCLLFGSVMTISYNVNMKASTAIVLDAMAVNDYKKIESIFVKSSNTQVIFGTLLLVLVWINIDTLFSFIKPEYAAGKYVILIIGLAKLFDLSSGINSLILAYSKYYKLDSLLVLSFVGLLYLLNHWLVPAYGLNGAAIAALISTIYYNAFRNILIWKFNRIHPYRKSLIFIILIGIILGTIGIYLPDLGESVFLRIVTLVYKCAFLGGFYIYFIYSLNISEEFNSVLKRVLKFF